MIVDEAKLVEQAQSGDQSAFMELVTHYKPKITKIACRFGRDVAEVSDLTQEIFLEIWKALPGYKTKAPFEHWLSKVALNRCRKYLRQNYQQRQNELLQDAPAPNEANSTNERSHRDAKEILEFAMAQLKPDDSLILTLRELQGYNMEEVAELTGWSVANIKVKTHRARKRLKEILEQSGEWP